MPLRVPPRQQVTRKFPVVDERAPSPQALDMRQWRLRVSGAVATPREWTYDEFVRLPQVTVTHDIHCVTRWSRLGCCWRGVVFPAAAEFWRPGFPAAQVDGLDLQDTAVDDLLEEQQRFLRQQGVLL